MTADRICEHCGGAYYSRERACQWLMEYLFRTMIYGSRSYPVEETTVERHAWEAGLSERALRQAAHDLKIVKSGSNVTWSLPRAIVAALMS
jgi:hypothetical protein